MQQFKVGDHVIVDEGDYLDNGLDGVVENTYDTGVVVRGWSTILGRTAARYYSNPHALAKVDDLVTGPFAPGDRAIVVGNTAYRGGGITHFIEVGTDVEVVSGPHVASSGATYYEVRGVHTGNDVSISQSVALCDLEAEPTYRPRGPVLSFYTKGYDLAADFDRAYSRAKRSIEFTLTPHAIDLLDGGTIASGTDHGSTDRAAALRDVVEMLGADTDGAKLVEVAEWLLSGKVPA